VEIDRLLAGESTQLQMAARIDKFVGDKENRGRASGREVVQPPYAGVMFYISRIHHDLSWTSKSRSEASLLQGTIEAKKIE